MANKTVSTKSDVNKIQPKKGGQKDEVQGSTRVKKAKRLKKLTGKKQSLGELDSNPAAPNPSAPNPSAPNQYERIAVAAYYIAEKRGFNETDPVQNWIDAEQEIEALEV